MRRRLELLIPIVLLAIAVQLFAPIAAFRAFAYAVNDPLYMASICTDMGAGYETMRRRPRPERSIITATAARFAPAR